MDYSQEYFTIESLESGNTITLTIGSSVKTSDVAWIAWSKDKTNWTTTNNVDNQTVTITVNAGIENVYFKGSGTKMAVAATLTNSNSCTIFSSTKTFSASGNIMSLLYGDNYMNQYSLTGTYAFCMLFLNSKIINACNLVLPATTISASCYRSMFRSCKSLVYGPELPSMNLQDSTYREMFYVCNSLIAAPELPATNLGINCYLNMFRECTSLTKAPVLPAATLKISSYGNMFRLCTNLQEVTCLATDISATNCTQDWLYNVAATGTFYKNPNMSSFPSGASGIPSGWTTEAANTFTYNRHYPDNITLNGTPLSYFKVNGTQVWRKIN